MMLITNLGWLALGLLLSLLQLFAWLKRHKVPRYGIRWFSPDGSSETATEWYVSKRERDDILDGYWAGYVKNDPGEHLFCTSVGR